ncbi:MAG: CPCC family cysteine-rich protein [Candidatus Sericytochromatia bacterium]
MTEKSMKREKAQALVRKYHIDKLTADERKEYLELYWDSEIYPDFESFSEYEIEKIPRELIQHMLSHDAPFDWLNKDFDIVLDLVYEDYTQGYTNTYLIQQLMEIGIECEEIEGDPEPMEHCYCCYYLVFKSEESFGSICPVCFWQDAPGANKTSLEQARKNFKEFGACDQGSLKYVSKEAVKMFSKHDPETQSPNTIASNRDQAHNIVNMWLGMGNNN